MIYHDLRLGNSSICRDGIVNLPASNTDLPSSVRAQQAVLHCSASIIFVVEHKVSSMQIVIENTCEGFL